MAKKKKPTKIEPKKPRFQSAKAFLENRQTQTTFGLFLAIFAIFLLVAFTSFLFSWETDQSELTEFTNKSSNVKNLLGKIGHSLSNFFMYKGFGIAAFILPILIFFTGIYLLLQVHLKKIRKSWGWGILGMLWLSILTGFFTKAGSLLSGVVGFEMNNYLQKFLGKTGVLLLLIFGLLSYFAIRFKINAHHISKLLKRKEKVIGQTSTDSEKNATQNDPVTQKTEELSLKPNESIEKSEFELSVENLQPTIKNYLGKKEPKKEVALDIETPPEEDVEIAIEKIVEEKTESENLSDKLVKDFGEFDPKLELGTFKFPTLNLLREFNESISIDQEELEANKNRIVETLNNYKIGIAQIKATVGPTVTLYEIVPEAGIRISKIKNLEDDIALSLSALGIRIIAPIPGKGTIGIEVPNKKATMVSMKSMIASTKFQNAQMELPIALGKTISNESFVVDLAKMPHLLMAGATGQGKSVGLNVILTSLLYKKHPAEVKFVLVDPKKVELTLFNKIERHYLAKLPDTDEAIITDTTKVVHTLNSLCIEMDNRYDLLKSAMVRNIKEYNEKFKTRKLNPENGHQFLPYIVLVIDEFADLIMTAGKEVETPIARLAQLARAIGIHLIVATQRPSVNVITGIIKANFPSRIAFRVTSKIDSRTILDSSGADQLIGKGDMLYSGGNQLVRIQCAFVDTPEVEKITDFIGSQKAYPEAHLLPEFLGEESGTSLDININDRDSLFKDACLVIVRAQQGSASLLQRKLKLGYNRAGRLIDQLEAAGIVGPFEGSKARQVLVPDEMALNQLLDNEKK
ncbi:FtsK/SpoIIIE family DNA translocase [Urechidicola croceus]|uniref:Cell division protein FtsK n=1 Tax=Urechidicola croceus TaxID=1850246 RepID=A0A1D8P5W9_9FLAO|nr:DNA translocase FtsK [Urechidicola croceus]AOW19949.1 cell division protein FtsK [Urechidicola croceus]